MINNLLSDNQIDALLVSNPHNIYYHSSFKGLSQTEREAWILITKKDNYFFTDARHQIFDISPDFQVRLITPKAHLIQQLKQIIIDEKIARLGFESEDIKYSEFANFQKNLNVELVSTTNLVIQTRAIKTPTEIDKIKHACQLTDRCLRDVSRLIRTGLTEGQLAFKIECWIKQKGHELAFYPIVAVDANSAIPHYDTQANGKSKVKSNSVVLIDCGVKFNSYCSDITRIFFVGKSKSEIINIYNDVLDAQQKTIDKLMSETAASTIDSFCRELITDNLKLTIPHSIGHGVGLEIHEFPKISAKSKDKLLPNQVFTIEPGVYLPGKFGIRIEDTVMLKNSSQPEVLTKSPKLVPIHPRGD